MPNAFAQLMLLVWPFVIWTMFKKMPAERAFLWAIIGGYMALPELTEFNLPMIPAFDKTSIPNITAFVICVMVLKMRPALMPDGLVGRAMLCMLIAAPVISVFFNLEPITFATQYSGRLMHVETWVQPLPGMRVYDSISALAGQIILILPFFLARHLLATEQAMTEVLRALVIAGLIYTIPILIEVRFSPQLHTWIYGFFQHSFEQMMREGGFRPIVFMPHGLWIALFMVMTMIAALHFARLAGPQERTKAWLTVLLLTVIVYLCRSLGPLMIMLCLATMILLLGAKWHLRISVGMAALTMSYPLLRGAGLIPTQQIVAWLEARRPDRAQSLEFRFTNEDWLLDRAWEKPLFGWGGWGRNQIYEYETGRMISVTDGQWVITIGQWGWLGYIAMFGLLCLPLVALWWRYRLVPAADIPPQASVLALLLGANLVDLLPNATMVPLTWLLAGTVLGHAELVHRRRLQAQTDQWRHAPVRDGLLASARVTRPIYKRSFL